MRKNLLSVLFIYFIANQAFAQGTITVDAGADQNACPNSCVQLSATAAVTGAGTSAYTVQQISYAPPPFNCGTPVNIAADDQWSPIVPIGFNFSFFGQTYSQLIMGANGIISFNTANAGLGCSWSIPAQPWPSTTPADVQNSITCPWHDIDPGVGGTFQYGLYGVAPFRIFAVTWNNVPMFSGACNAQLATHQIILYETTNVIETFIQNKPLCAGWNGGQAIHGIQNAAGTVAYIVPGRNAGTQWTATNDAWRFNPNGTSTSGAGVTFTWFNGATQIGTGANITVTPTQSTTYTVVATGPGGITATDQVVVNMSTLAIPTLSNTSICGTGSTNLNLTMPVVPPLVFTDVLPPTVYTPGSTLDVPINVTGVPAGSVQNGSIASVCVSVVQPIVGQLRLYLISPTGQQIDLSSNNGLASNGYNNVCFSPTATIPVTNYTNIPIPANSTLLPEQNFSLLNCSAINDIWILRVQHTGGGGSGGQNGTFNSVTLTFNNPLASTYNWSPASGLSCTNCANPVATPTAATTYNVTVSAQNGCTATANVNVAVNTLAQPDVTAGANNNSATFNWLAVTGADHYEVSINGGAPQNIGTVTTFTQNGLTPGQVVNFSVVAIAATGSTCGNSLAGTATATASCPSVAASISGNLNICSGSNTTLTATAGFAGYLWSNGATTQAITINQANTYFVTVTNAQGCTGSASATVNSSTTQVNIIGGEFFCTCQGALLDAGAGFVAYQWSNSSSNRTISITTTGTYSVTVTNAAGCTSTDQVIINTTAPTATVTGGNICAGASSTLGTTQPYAGYSWSTGATTPTAVVSPPGTYRVTVTSDGGCTGTASITITQLPFTQPTIAGSTIICNGGGTTLTVNPTYSSYSWSPSATTQSINVNTAGTNSVTVTAANGCTGTASVTVTSTPTNASITGTLSYCAGSSTTLTVAGGFTQFTWSNALTTQAIVVNTPGTYSVTASTANGCTGTASVTVTELTQPTLSITGGTTICNGASKVLGTSTPFSSYQWTGGLTTATITASTAGTYSLTATAANGCTASAQVTVTLSPNLTPIITPSGPTTFCAGGNVTLDPGIYTTYHWSNNATTQTINVSTTGNYIITVSNASGCTGTASQTVQANGNLTVGFTNPTQAICPNTSAVLTANISGGVAPYTYLWSNAETTVSQTVNPTAATTYTISATDANGCSGTGATTVTLATPPTANAGTDFNLCPGATGSLAATATGGVAPYTFTWDNALGTGANHNITPSTATTYTVLVTDANGCTGTDAINVGINQSPSASAGNDVAVCNGVSTTLTATGSNGQSPYTFAWSNNVQNATNQVTPNTTTTYIVTVTDANGCTATDDVIVTVNTNPSPTITPNGATSFCFGGSVVLDGGAGYSTYSWSPGGEISQTIAVTQTGTYSLTVTDANGCSGTAAQNVTAFPLPTANAGPDLFTQPNVGINLQGSGTSGTTPYSYTWDNGLNPVANPLATVPVTTVFSLTLTDANGCTATDDMTLFVCTPPIVNAGLDQAICLNQSASLSVNATGGAGSYTFQWNSGQNTQAISVSPTVTTDYIITVTDGGGCFAFDTVNVVVNSLPTPTVVTTNGATSFCFNNDLILDAGTGYSAYTWFNNSGSQQITVGQSGTYSVTVTDANGCQGSDDITVTEFAPLLITGVTDSVSCAGYNNGSINITPTGGNGTYSIYAWSNSAITQDITGLTAGTYSVTVFDSFGCVGNATFQIGEPATAVGVFVNAEDASCYGVSNGIAIANPYGGTGPYSFNWSSGAATQTANGLTPNITYIVTVTDSRGCQDTAHVFIDQPAALVVNTVTVVPTTCYNTATGSATVIASSGTPSYAYQWSNGATTPTANNLPAGTATVIVSDANGCLEVENIVIPEPAPVVPIIGTVTPPDCSGTNTGHATVSGSGGTPPYSYLWDAGAGSQQLGTATGLASGSYTVTVTDFHGCTGTKVVVVPTGTDLEVEIHQTAQVICNGDATAALQVTATGGVPAYTYLWSNGDTNALADSLTAGNYNVVVTDSHGCTVTASESITEPAPLIATLTADSLTCYDSGDGQIAVAATGGRVPYTYNIDGGGFQSGSNFPGLEPGMHYIITHDFNGCEYLDSIEVIAPDTFTAVITPIDTTLEFGDTYGIEVTVNPQGNITYIWTPHATLSCIDCPDPTVNVTTSNVYTVLVRDENGCEITLQSALSATFPRRVYVANLFSPNNDGKNDVFLVQGGRGVKQVKVFRVYDRWGEMVHEALDVAPNDLAGGWNGTFRGKDMSGAVFTWYAEVLYDDGKTEFIKGDVTLVR